MRDQYVSDISDLIKFSLLRALAGEDRILGIAWYYVPGNDGRADGRHLEWLREPSWRLLDPLLHRGLMTLPERSIAALESAAIWPTGTIFHREPMPSRIDRENWAAQKRERLRPADLIFLDPDNGLGKCSPKHATLSELRLLRRPGRAIVFITFPGRNMPHDSMLRQLHQCLIAETGTRHQITLRTTVSIPRAEGSRLHVPRQRWFTIVDPDTSLAVRAQMFATALGSVPRVRVRLDGEA